jgi:glycosyltransferase involved in cell wall biosynthesis
MFLTTSRAAVIEKPREKQSFIISPISAHSWGQFKQMIDRHLRFCMITTFYPPYNFGGDGIFVHHLSNELAQRGHRVEVIHCIDAYRSLAHQKPANTYENHSNVTVHGLRSPFGFLSPMASHQTGLPLFKSSRIKQILEKGFDIIHYHNISLFGPKILEYGQGIKLYTMHEYWLVCPTHALFRFNRAPCTRPYCLLCSLTYKRPPQWWRYFGLLGGAVKDVDAFIAPSLISLYKHRQMGLNVPMVHLPNFVPLTGTALPTSDPPADKTSEGPYFLFVGRLEKFKGLQTIIPVFRHFHKARLLIAGTGKYEPQLRQLADGSTNIRFLGYASGQQLQTLYRHAVAVIYPAINFQGFPQLPRGAGAPLVIMEAFSQRTPVIVTDLGRIPELIRESNGGLVYSTEKELVAAMDQLVTNPSYRHELGLNGYQAYQQNWTVEAHIQRYLALIYEIAATRGQDAESKLNKG